MDKKIVICDLDGCLVDSSWIWKVVRMFNIKEPFLWDIFNRNANAAINKVDELLIRFLRTKLTAGMKIVFLTARSELVEVETINFIQEKTGLVYGRDFTVNSRKMNDTSTSVDSKAERLDALILAGAKIDIALDDDIDIVKMYINKGIKAYRWVIGTIPGEMVLECGGNLSHLVEEVKPCLN